MKIAATPRLLHRTRAAAALLAASTMLTGCISRSEPPVEVALKTLPMPAAPRPIPVAETPAPAPASAPPVSGPARGATADPAFAARIAALGRGFNGDVGIAVRDVHAGWTASWNGRELFPQQSVSKLWVAIAVMDALDRGTMRLEDPYTVTNADMTVFHQPIRGVMRNGAYQTTIGDLLTRAMTQSDNTCNDILLRRVGGPAVVNALIARARIARVRFGPGERLLQSGTAGLAWRPEYAFGNAFQAARGALSPGARAAAMARYLADPVDGASPDGIADGLAKLKRGEIVSPESAQRLISIMYASRTGPSRMKAGSAPGWQIAHKTGTGQNLGGYVAGYNDVGLVTAPDGTTYAVAILIGRTREGIPARQRLMADVTRAVVEYETQKSG